MSDRPLMREPKPGERPIRGDIDPKELVHPEPSPPRDINRAREIPGVKSNTPRRRPFRDD